MKKPLPLLMVAAILCLGSCSKNAGSDGTILYASAQVNAADGSPLRVARLSPETPISLSKGEWAEIGTTKYESALTGDPGEIRLEHGKVKTSHLKVTDLTR